jgi:Homeodomain-like domain
MGTLTMSDKERQRVGIMASVKAGDLSLVEASKALGLCYRQVKRVWGRYQDQGDSGLVHRLRGKPGQRRKPPELRAKVLARYEERYPDFGPTLAAEYLAEEKLLVNHETLRRWLLAENKRTVRRRRQRHRQWRERKPCFGVMVQLDGSHHDWFEGRGEKCVLMVMVDDATNRVWAQFFEEETTRASYDVLEGWVKKQGLPQSLYVDRDSIYRCEGLGSIAEQMAGQEPQTQFGRAMKQLGVELILANSPQAKGRVERMNGVLQDRLVKALRLEGINDMERANAYLRRTYLPRHNRRFEFKAASQADAHQRAPQGLKEILSWERERVVQGDWTVACEGKWYQLDRQHEPLSLAGKKVIVRTLRNGRVQLERKGTKLKWRELSGRPQRVKPQPRVQSRKPRTDCKPAADHPWRKMPVGSVLGALKRRSEKPLVAGDSGRPPLRSGLPPSPTTRGLRKQTQTRGHFLLSS